MLFLLNIIPVELYLWPNVPRAINVMVEQITFLSVYLIKVLCEKIFPCILLESKLTFSIQCCKFCIRKLQHDWNKEHVKTLELYFIVLYASWERCHCCWKEMRKCYISISATLLYSLVLGIDTSLEYKCWISEEPFEVPGASTSPNSMAPYRARQNYIQLVSVLVIVHL